MRVIKTPTCYGYFCESNMSINQEHFISSLMSGSSAGLCVDLALYPLDTIKTRIQSADGFLRSGGFRGIYSGLGSVAMGSMPGAALFFTTYETVKAVTKNVVPKQYLFASHMGAASCGEVVACLIRVPVEVVKQRTMVSQQRSSWSVLSATVRQEGFLGLYRGYFSTVIREIPFSLIQFPLWEYLKNKWSVHQGKPPDPWQSALCGALSGGIAAGITTPLDVAKTRIMLAEQGSSLASGSISGALQLIYHERGVNGLFAGVLPRVMWISIGGAIFLGVYDKTKLLCGKILVPAGS